VCSNTLPTELSFTTLIGINVPNINKYFLHLIRIGHFLKVHRAISVLSALLITSPCQAITFSDWVTNEVGAFLSTYSESLKSEKGYRLDYKTGKIDPRLNLSLCNSPAIFSFQSDPMYRNKTTVKVECNDKKRWSIFVGVKVNIFKTVWVASQTLPRNHRLTHADLQQAEIQINKSRKGYFDNQSKLLGMRLRRSINEGLAFYPSLLSPPKVIERGDTVVISALSQVISVEVLGTAMSDGKLGQQISVKNKRSSRIIRATVVAKGKVAVPM